MLDLSLRPVILHPHVATNTPWPDGFDAPIVAHATPFAEPDAELIQLPSDRGSAAAICAVVEHVCLIDPDAVLVIVLNGQLPAMNKSLIKSIAATLPLVQSGEMVTLGTTSGDGDTLIEMAQGTVASTSAQPIKQIIQGLTPAQVKDALATQRFQYSAGLMLTTAKTLRGFFGRFAAPMRAAVRRSIKNSRTRQNITVPGADYANADVMDFETQLWPLTTGHVVNLPAPPPLPADAAETAAPSLASANQNWGTVDVLRSEDGARVRWITLLPDCSTPPRVHREQTGTLIVVKGAARAQIDGLPRSLGPNDRMLIPKSHEYSITNVGDEPLCLVEIQVAVPDKRLQLHTV